MKPRVPTTEVFAKLADKPAPKQCMLEAWSLEAGMEGGSVRVAYFDVNPNRAYESVICGAARSGKAVQIGIKLPDGHRMLLTGSVTLLLPRIWERSVLRRFRLEVEKHEVCSKWPLP